MATGLRIGRYELGERLGTGGFGVVYHARDTELGRELAIKVLRPEYQTQPDVVARFLKEARAAAKIDHPGIVTVFECGTISGSGTAQDGNAYIAMELLRGIALTQHLEQLGRMALGEAILIGRQVAAALSVAHAAGIVHRDLKPDNVFLLPDPLVKGGFRIKILDFGVAKLAEPKEVGVNTHSQMMLGTPKYMSPEQARSARAVDQRTDIYTLGCMLYEMLTGQAPYEGPGAIDMIIQHTTAPIPSPKAIVHGLADSMDALIRRMLAKEPDERPASMQEIDQALAAIQAEVVPPSIPPAPPLHLDGPTETVAPLHLADGPTPPAQLEPTGLTPTPPFAARAPRPTPPPPLPARAPARPTPPPPLPSTAARASARTPAAEDLPTSARMPVSGDRNEVRAGAAEPPARPTPAPAAWSAEAMPTAPRAHPLPAGADAMPPATPGPANAAMPPRAPPRPTPGPAAAIPPRAPARPTPGPTAPRAAAVPPRAPPRPTPSPATAAMPASPILPPMRPAPQPPARPSPVAIGTVVDSSPFPDLAPRPPRASDDEAPTTTQRASTRSTARRRASRAPLFAGVGVLAFAIAATAVWFALREDRPEHAAVVEARPQAPEVEALPAAEVAKLRQDCLDLEKALFWKELKECSDRLEPHDRALAERLWKTADDEAANETKWKGVQKYVEKKDFSRARDLVKRIGEGSVYTERAHRLLEQAEAEARP